VLTCEEDDEEDDDDEEEIEWVAETVGEGEAAKAHGEQEEGKAKQRKEGKAAVKRTRRQLKRTYLLVPYIQKDEAKDLGAR
jgi:hypothetical protein